MGNTDVNAFGAERPHGATDSGVTVKTKGVNERAQGSLRIILTAKTVKVTGGHEDAREKGQLVPARRPVNANFFCLWWTVKDH